MDPVIAKYLARHAAPEIAVAARLHGPYAHVCAIPAMDEPADFLDGLGSVRAAGPWLVIVVVNGTDAAAPMGHTRNAALLAALRTRGEARPLGREPPAWLIAGAMPGVDLLAIDRASPGWRLPRDQGVGMARRIGCDIALALHAAGALGTRWIHMTDADVTLPADYFEAAARAPAGSVALTYPFWHQASGDALVDAATGLYELYLRYHRLGLARAGSPYALHTVGSSLAVDARAYAAVRGVPMRQAAEDFYLVNKLVKLGPVVEPAAAPLRIRARRSARVPFGTGAATSTIAGELAAGRPYRMYHPRIYALLGAWLEAMDDCARAPGAHDDVDACSDGGIDLHIDRCLDQAATSRGLSPGERRALDAALDALGARAALQGARARAHRPDARARRVRDWFDGFRTLKLVHALRDAALPSLPWHHALAAAPFLAGLLDMAPMPPELAAPGPLDASTTAALTEHVTRLRRLLAEREGLACGSRH